MNALLTSVMGWYLTAPLGKVCADMKATGLGGFQKLTNTIAGWALAGALFAAVVGLLVFALGPSFGLESGRRYGTRIMLGALAVAIGLATIAGLINLVYAMFGGC